MDWLLEYGDNSKYLEAERLKLWMSWWVESNESTACPGGWMNHMLFGISRSTAGRLRLSAVLVYLALVRLHLRCCIEFWDPQYKDMLAKCGGCSWGPLGLLGAGKQICRKMEWGFAQKCRRAVAVRCSKENNNWRQGEDYSLCGQALTQVTQGGSGNAILGHIQDLKG